MRVSRSDDGRIVFELGVERRAAYVLVTEEGGPALWELTSDRFLEDIERAQRLALPHVSMRPAPLAPTLVYGSVPAGFRQTAPETGAPAPLRAGARYRLQIGSEAGVPFVAPE